MQNNPFHERTTDQMEELQPKRVVPQTPHSQPHPIPGTGNKPLPPPTAESESAEERPKEDAFTAKFAAGKLNDYLRWLMMVIELFLCLRFILKVFGANPANPFATLVFDFTDFLLIPFASLVAPISMHANQEFETATLIAMAVYFILFYILQRFVRILVSNPEGSE